MKTILSALVGLVLAGAAAYGVKASETAAPDVNPAGNSSTVTVPYGK